MELKVWVEGIQRIVCGVGDTTTCQDVVFALAHATGKTGRFTLIERWRNNERLLAPSEQPLKVLMKWGERSNDVQFILQWSPLDSPNPPNCKSSTKPPDVTLNEFNSKSHSSSGSGTPTNSSQFNNGGASSKRQLGQFLPNNSSNNSPNGCWPVDKSSSSDNDSLTKRKETNTNATSDINSSDIHKNISTTQLLRSNNHEKLTNNSKSAVSFPRIEDESRNSSSGPPPYRQPPNPNPSSKLSSSNKELPPYRDPPPPNLILSNQRIGNNSSPVSSLNSHPGSIIGNNLVNNSNSNASSVLSFSRDISANNSISSMNGSVVRDSSSSSVSKDYFKGSSSSYDNSSTLATLNNSSDMTENSGSRKNKDFSLTNGDTSSPTFNGISSKSTSQSQPVPTSNNPFYRDLVRLINLQREKLTSQQAELTQYDAEIMFWEGKAKEQQKQMDFITKEITRLESMSTQHESQMLSLSHIEQENEALANESERLKNELSSLKSEFGQCEQELTQCKSKIRLLSGDVQSTQSLFAQREDERKQREIATLVEIERLRKELDIARRDTDAVSDLSGSLDNEVTSMENTLSDKKKQMEQLVSAMKEANLQSLAIQSPTADEIIDGGTHYRSGSTRRMIGSPRQLENAAPTSKNPHGVWV